MDRILILGCSGAGKSTLARELGEILHIPVIHLDKEYWRPGWKPTPEDEWQQRAVALAERDRWIMDGNYGSTLAMRLARADGVIVMDYPRRLCLWRVVKRMRRHWGRTRPDVAPGCAERWDWEFLRFVWSFNKKGRIRNYRMIEEQGLMEKTVVLRGPGETRAFLEKVREKGNI